MLSVIPLELISAITRNLKKVNETIIMKFFNLNEKKHDEKLPGVMGNPNKYIKNLMDFVDCLNRPHSK